MDKLPVSARILITLCFLIACLMGTVSLMAVMLTAVDLGGGLPLRYFEQLNFPLLMVLFPVIGMAVIGGIALALRIKGMRFSSPAGLDNVASAEIAVEPKRAVHYPKAA